MLTQQKQKYEAKLKARKKGKHVEEPLTPEEERLARISTARWSRRSSVKMAEEVLTLAANLKEANIIATELQKDVVYQFAILDSPKFPSSIHNSIHGLDEGDEADSLDGRPTIAVKVRDRANSAIYLWSTARLRRQL